MTKVMNNKNIKVEANGLHLEGYLPPASILAGVETLDLNAISFKTMIPAKYLAMLGSSRMLHSDWIRQKDKESNEKGSNLDSMLAAHLQQEIDNHVITLRLNGMSVDIKQGDLREIMETRLEELKERRKQLIQNGASAEEIEACDGLIERYEPVVVDLKEGTTDDETVNGVEGLMRDDPKLNNRLNEHCGYVVDHAVSQERKGTSFSSQYFDTGAIEAPSLTAAFKKSNLPEQPAVSEAPLPPTKNEQDLNNSLDSMGF